MIKLFSFFFKSISRPNLRLIVVLFACLSSNVVKADHYYGGYFFYETIGDKTVQVTLVTYTDFHNNDSDRPSAEFDWGDGQSSSLSRVNIAGEGEEVYLGMKKNVYVGSHEYKMYNNYQLYFSDHFRLKDVNNMTVGLSGLINLRFDGVVPVQDSNVYCNNDSPIPLLDPYFYGKENQEFQLNFGYHDLQGDSMAFKLVDCKDANGDTADGYTIPNGATVDVNTGQFKWDSPKKGRYCFSLEVAEYRNSELLGKSSTDFTLFISLQDYLSLDRGTFTGPSTPLYVYTSPSTKQFIINYYHADADSVMCSLVSPLTSVSAFVVTQKTSRTNTTFSDTVDVEYKGDFSFNGYQSLVWEVKAFIGNDSVMQEVRTVGIAINDEKNWNCEVPDISELHEQPPVIPALVIAPSIFEDNIWINVGANYENITMNVFDLRGRLVESYFNLSGSTVKLDLRGLSSAMYILQVLKDGKEIHAGKIIKR
jgi:hypothetical protein